MRQIRITAWIAVAALLLAGCGSRHVTMNTWRTSLERYAMEYASGDTSFLRDAPDGSPHRQFAVIGANSPNKSTDAKGVLLGLRTIDDQLTHVFLVGLTKHRSLEDVRIALMSHQGNRFHWSVSQQNPQALREYLDYKASRWRQQHPDRSEPPAGFVSFPAEEDVFDLSVTGRSLTVIERNSGARWEIALHDDDDAQAKLQ